MAQFRQVRVATTQINSTIKHILLCQPPPAAPQNLSSTRTRNPIYPPRKIFNLSSKSIPSFGVWKPQTEP